MTKTFLQIDGTIEEMIEEEVAMDIERQDKIFNIIQDNVQKVQERTRWRLESGDSSLKLQVGDMVWRNVKSQQRKGGKLNPELFGPYTVTVVRNKSLNLVDSMD